MADSKKTNENDSSPAMDLRADHPQIVKTDVRSLIVIIGSAFGVAWGAFGLYQSVINRIEESDRSCKTATTNAMEKLEEFKRQVYWTYWSSDAHNIWADRLHELNPNILVPSTEPILREERQRQNQNRTPQP